VPNPDAGFASGRAEDYMLFHKKIHSVNFFVKKIKTYHAAAGESGFHRVKRPV
jgi:hypothetical protein